MLKKWFFIVIFFISHCIYAYSDNQKISLDLENVAIQDVLHIIAKRIHHNIVISPAVQGVTSLHVDNVPAKEAFDGVLIANGLIEWKINAVWYVGLRTEWVKHKQEELKLQTLLAETAPLVTRVWQIHYAKAEDMLHILEDSKHALISKRGHVRIDKRTNMICVTDSEERITDIHRLISRLDVPVQQVLIEAHLASIDSDYERELGIHFSVREPTAEAGLMEAVSANSGIGLAVVKLADGSRLDMQLSALEKAGHGELISSPSLFTANQQTASIESGEEIPYQEVSGSGATAVTFKKAVLSLKVTPQIMPGNQVMLQLQVNQDKPSKRTVLGVPAISTRQISTNILVKSGETIVLGGIYESNREQDQQEIPFLGKIPLVGWLFRQQNVINNKRELLIFVTPKIII